MAEAPRAAPARTARTGRDLYMLGVMDRINDQFRLLDTMILGACSDSWDYLPPRGKHLLWLKLASSDTRWLEEVGLPVENGVLMHWSMWPPDLGDYAQAIALKQTRDTMLNLEPRNVAMQAAMDQARVAERTAGLQIQLADRLVQLVAMGANPEAISVLFSKNKHDRAAIGTIIERAEETMIRAMEHNEQQQQQQQHFQKQQPQSAQEMREEMDSMNIDEMIRADLEEQESNEYLTEEEILRMDEQYEEVEENDDE